MIDMPTDPAGSYCKPENAALLDAYFKKTVTAEWAGRSVAFDIPETGFSSFQLDRGTLRLLRNVGGASCKGGTALDLGCGYGPIALYLAVNALASRVTGIDRDALAVAFAQRNAEKNGIVNAHFTGGLGYEPVGRAERFSLIASNVPAKAGDPAHRALLLDAGRYLLEDGQVAIVVVSELAPRVDAILADGAVEVTDKISFPGHVVYIYRFVSTPESGDDWPYRRGRVSMRWGAFAYEIETVYGLGEFDTLSYATELLLKVVIKNVGELTDATVIAWDPGQGHIPLILGRAIGPLTRMILISRDALGLRQSGRNLVDDAFCGRADAFHSIDLCPQRVGEDADLAVGVLNEKESPAIHAEKLASARATMPDVPIYLGCSSSLGSHLARALSGRGMKATQLRKQRGVCVIRV